MKRMLLAAASALVLAGVLAAPADAAVRTMKGPVQGGGTFAMDVLIQSGDAVAVGDLKAKKIPVECDQGPAKVNFGYSSSLGLDENREFSYDFSTYNAHIDGKVNKKETKVIGELSYGPDNSPSGLTGCDGGGLHGYTAKRT